MNAATQSNGTHASPGPRLLRLTFHGVPVEECIPHAPGPSGRAACSTSELCSEPSVPSCLSASVPSSLLNHLLSLFLDTPSSLPELAASLSLTVAELLKFTARSDVAAMLEQLKALSALRADVIASASRAQALLALQTLVTTCAIDTHRDRENTRLAASAMLRYKPGNSGGTNRRLPRQSRRASATHEDSPTEDSQPSHGSEEPGSASPLEFECDSAFAPLTHPPGAEIFIKATPPGTEVPGNVRVPSGHLDDSLDRSPATPEIRPRRLRGIELKRAVKRALAAQRARARAPT